MAEETRWYHDYTCHSVIVLFTDEALFLLDVYILKKDGWFYVRHGIYSQQP